jgi:hypothetical protein
VKEFESWDLSEPAVPRRSECSHLQPMGFGTGYVECPDQLLWPIGSSALCLSADEVDICLMRGKIGEIVSIAGGPIYVVLQFANAQRLRRPAAIDHPAGSLNSNHFTTTVLSVVYVGGGGGSRTFPYHLDLESAAY